MDTIKKVANAILDAGEGCQSGLVYVDPVEAAKAAISVLETPIVTEKMIEAAARAMCEAWHYAKIGTPDGNAEWRNKQDQYRKQARAALEAALSTDAEPVKTAPSVAVKALEWNDDPCPAAESILGHYVINELYAHVELLIGYGRGSMTGLGRIELWRGAPLADLKAAAQADYEARIRSALSAQVQDVALTRLAIRAGGSGANVYAFTEADDDGDYVFYTEAKAALSVNDEADWRLIVTAPKDGSDMLLSSPHWHGDIVVGCWSFEGWRDRDDADALEPTHWMPLPAAPAAKLEEKP